jgi:hypothetical protein
MFRVAVMSVVGSPSTSSRSADSPGGDTAAVGQGEAAGGRGRGGMQRLDRTESGVGEKFQLLVQARAVCGARAAGIGAGEQRDAGVGEGCCCLRCVTRHGLWSSTSSRSW